MPRLRKYDDAKILEAAAQVFLEEGAQATTAVIARRAGVSEGVLFQRFKTKELLLEAALTHNPGQDDWREELLARVGKGTPEANLKRAIVALFKKLHRMVPRRMILEGRGLHRAPVPGKKAPPLEDAEVIEEYLRREARLGRVKVERPDLHAHEIVGAVAHVTRLNFRHRARVCSPERWAAHLVKVHLAGAGGRDGGKNRGTHG